MSKVYGRVVALLAAGFTIALMIYAGRGWEKGIAWWAGACLFGAWAVSPYIGMALFSRAEGEFKGKIARLIGFTLIAAFGVIVLIDGFFIHLDAQNALLFIFLPISQWIGIGIILAISSFIGKKGKRAAGP